MSRVVITDANLTTHPLEKAAARAAAPLPTESPLRAAPLPSHAACSNTAAARLQLLVADEIARALPRRPPRRPIAGPSA